MDAIVAVMLLVGCNGDGSSCTEIPAPAPLYASVEECRNALPFEMRMTSTYDQRVLGACEAVDEALLEDSATIDWAVSRAGELIVEITPEIAPALAEATIDTAAMQIASR